MLIKSQNVTKCPSFSCFFHIFTPFESFASLLKLLFSYGLGGAEPPGPRARLPAAAPLWLSL